jgi:hypothetical protein
MDIETIANNMETVNSSGGLDEIPSDDNDLSEQK